MEPIFLEPVYKDYIWGGTRIKYQLNKNTPFEKTAESWEVSTNSDGKSIILDGEYKDKTLEYLFNIKEIRKEIFGTKTVDMANFPLLIKYIDAESNLSVQVHPNDEYAKRVENDIGKTEMWYIMDADPDAQIIYGIKENVTLEQLKHAIDNNNIEPILNYVTIRPNDIIYIPAGTVHAILKNTLICEIQQNSNLTYRVYDWGRVDKYGKPRKLHIDKAIDVIDISSKPQIKNTGNFENETNIISSKYFNTNKIVVKDYNNFTSSNETFYIINVIKGEGVLITSNKDYKIKYGDSFIIPANMGEYEIRGKIEMLKTYL